MKRIFTLMLLWMAAHAGVSQAAVVSHMYEVSLPVLNQDRDMRAAAFQQGFVQVLVRVTGNSLAPTQIDVTQAAQYVQQYRYTALDTPLVKPSSTDGTPETVANYDIWIQFNEGAIKKLLKDKEQPLWGKQRPSVLVWLAVRDGRNRYVLRAGDYSSIKETVEKEAKRRGLPLLWPDYDEQDKKILGFADIWGSFWEPVMQASQRYSVNAVLIGRMNWVADNWVVDWSLRLDDRVQSWHLSAPDLSVIMASGIDVATDQIASRFAVQEDGADEGDLLVHVRGVGDVAGYARSLHYLKSLALVRTVYPRQVDGDSVAFFVDVSGNRDDLKRIIGLGKTLVAVAPPKQPLAPGIVPGVPGNSDNNPGDTGNPGEAGNPGTITPQPALQALYYRLKP